MSRASIACLAAVLLLAGCATIQPSGGAPAVNQPPPPPPPPPRQMEYAAIQGLGDFVTPRGSHATCAGQSVALTADTPANRARMAALYGSADRAMASVAQVKARAARLGPGGDLVNSVTCDGSGRFAFAGLPPGGYFVIARVRVDRPSGAEEQYVVMQSVHLRTGETREMRLAP